MVKITYLTLLLCFSFVSNAQHTVKIIGSESGESIPYANISIGTQNTISNDDGYFTIPNNDGSTKIIISSMGYEGLETTAANIERMNYVVKLATASLQLDEVDVKRQDPKQIMAMVQKNMAKNYTTATPFVKDRMFVRTTNSFSPKLMQIEITKSTGFSKKKLEQANSDIKKFVKQMIDFPVKDYRDMLVDYYSAKATPAKIDVIKGTTMRDESRALDADEMDKNMGNLFLKHLDSTKYYRIKSGLIGSRDTITMRKDFKKKKAKTVNNTTDAKKRLSRFLESNHVSAKGDLTFMNDPDAYNYSYEGATYLNNDEFVYILRFSPRKNRADYEGKMYISDTDYAIVRADYKLAAGKTSGGVNLKLIFGIKFSQNVDSGTLIYKKSELDNAYYLNYASVDTGSYFYVNRPLKFIEITDEDRDVFALEIKVEGNSRFKTEFLNMSRSESSQNVFANQNEQDFKYLALKKYDPKIWKEFSAIEPLDEMKQFSVPE